MKFNFNFNVERESKSPISENLPVPVSAETKANAKRIKESSDRNRKIFNDLSRQFLDVLIEKFDSGEFDDIAS